MIFFLPQKMRAVHRFLNGKSDRYGRGRFHRERVRKKAERKGIEGILIVDSLGASDKRENLQGRRFSDYLHKNVFIGRLISGSLEFEPQAMVHMGACSSTTVGDVEYLMENNYRYTKTLALGRPLAGYALFTQAAPPPTETEKMASRTGATFVRFAR